MGPPSPNLPLQPVMGVPYRPPPPSSLITIADEPPVELPPATLADAIARMSEAEDTLRAIGAGEIDAFVVSDRGAGRRVFTLATADRPYRMFVENMRDGAATLSASGLILYANRRLAELLNLTREQVVGWPLERFVFKSSLQTWELMRNETGSSIAFELDMLSHSGSRVPVLVGVSPLEVDGGQLSCLTFTDLSAQRAQDEEIARLGVAQAERLTELQDAQAALTQQATHDALTGLPNRALLIDRIDQSLARARRTGGCTALFFVDLDGFKQVNDTHGHAAGDEVLRATGRRLAGALRAADTVARIGGDEFVVLAHDVDNELHAVDIGTRLVSELRQHQPAWESSEPVTASIGIAVAIAGSGSAESLLNEADAAMYQAKSQGGGRAAVFDEALGLQVMQRATGRRMLQLALDRGDVIAHYQPILDLSCGAVAGFEALARLAGPGGEIIQPYAFIPSAEESGLVVPLGAEVLGLATREANQWPVSRADHPGLSVAVNLSSRQFESGALVDTVRDRLDSSGLDPQRLHLELTETATIDLRHDVLAQLGQLRDLGVEIGLDDFGTGYGSLTHLRRLPLTFVKIDRSFVNGLGTVREDERIISAVVNLASNLGLRCIAEGVETRQQLALLKDMGCEQAQGYLFDRPMPDARITETLAREPWSFTDV